MHIPRHSSPDPQLPDKSPAPSALLPPAQEVRREVARGKPTGTPPRLCRALLSTQPWVLANTQQRVPSLTSPAGGGGGPGSPGAARRGCACPR